jgi:hypothetical protein
VRSGLGPPRRGVGVRDDPVVFAGAVCATSAQINLAYGELAAFYGTLIDPARARKPKDKPRIERPMPYIRDSFFAGRQFASVAQMQADALRWATEVYGRHKHRGWMARRRRRCSPRSNGTR